MQKLLFLILLYFFSNLVHAQTDTVFWFAAPQIIPNDASGPNPHTNHPVYFRITAYNQIANVFISEPANPAFIPINLTVPANSSLSIDMTPYIAMLESKPANQVLNFGVLVKSNQFITAYYEENSSSNPEMFVLKGKNALGKNFFIPAQNIMQNWNDIYTPPPNPFPTSSFDIVASEDNTTVTITPAQNITGHAAGLPFSIVLNKGQSYSAAAIGRLPNEHLMGSTVTSDKPVAITIKDDSIGGAGYSGCLDLAGDQIVPVELVGMKYISLPGYLNDPVTQPTDHVFIMATQDNTVITINGVVENTINKGFTHHRAATNEVLYMTTSKPVYVLHLSGFGCEVGHALLPQLDCTGSSKVAFTRSVSTNLFMNILVPSGYEDKFTFNGNASIITANLFSDVPFSSGQWKYARIQLSTTQLPVNAGALVENTGIEFHLALVNGDGTGGCRYGYFSDYNQFTATATSNAVNGVLCENSTLQFNTNYYNAKGVSFSWTGPNGFTSTQANPSITNITPAGSGNYNCIITKFACLAISVDLPITVTPTPRTNLSSNSPLCEGKKLDIIGNYIGSGTPAYQWLGPNGFISNLANIIINSAALKDSGYYKVQTTANNCVGNDSILIQIKPTPVATIQTINNNACRSESVQLNNSNTVAGTVYSWNSNNGFSSSLQSIVFNSINYADSGLYILTANTNGCIAKDSVMVKVKQVPNVQVQANDSLCSNAAPVLLSAKDISGLPGNGVFSGVGVSSSGLFDPTIVGSGTVPIKYTYTATNGCTDVKEIDMTVYPAPQIVVPSVYKVLAGKSIPLNAVISGNLQSIVWTPVDYLSDASIANPICTPKKNITYKLTAISDKNCIVEQSVSIKIQSSIFIPNAFSPNGDGVNDHWEIESLGTYLHLHANVYDRYGVLVHTSSGYQISWDGKYKGELLPVATYYYIVISNDGISSETYSGWIQLLR